MPRASVRGTSSFATTWRENRPAVARVAGRGKKKPRRSRPLARARAPPAPRVRAKRPRANPRQSRGAGDADARDAESPRRGADGGDVREKAAARRTATAPEPPAKRPRGRPEGSKNKPKDAPRAARPEKHARAAFRRAARRPASDRSQKDPPRRARATRGIVASVKDQSLRSSRTRSRRSRTLALHTTFSCFCTLASCARELDLGASFPAPKLQLARVAPQENVAAVRLDAREDGRRKQKREDRANPAPFERRRRFALCKAWRSCDLLVRLL